MMTWLKNAAKDIPLSITECSPWPAMGWLPHWAPVKLVRASQQCETSQWISIGFVCCAIIVFICSKSQRIFCNWSLATSKRLKKWVWAEKLFLDAIYILCIVSVEKHGIWRRETWCSSSVCSSGGCIRWPVERMAENGQRGKLSEACNPHPLSTFQTTQTVYSLL